MEGNRKEFIPSSDNSTEGQIKTCLMTVNEIMEDLTIKGGRFNKSDLSGGIQELEKLLGVYNGEDGYDELFDRTAKEKFFQAKKLLEELGENEKSE